MVRVCSSIRVAHEGGTKKGFPVDVTSPASLQASGGFDVVVVDVCFIFRCD